jgi:hypothetical protein
MIETQEERAGTTYRDYAVPARFFYVCSQGLRFAIVTVCAPDF